MTKFNKLWGGLVGVLVALGGVWGLDLEWLNDPKIQTTVFTILTLLGVVVAPANK